MCRRRFLAARCDGPTWKHAHVAGIPNEGGAVLLRQTDSTGAFVGGKNLQLLNCVLAQNTSAAAGEQ